MHVTGLVGYGGSGLSCLREVQNGRQAFVSGVFSFSASFWHLLPLPAVSSWAQSLFADADVDAVGG